MLCVAGFSKAVTCVPHSQKGEKECEAEAAAQYISLKPKRGKKKTRKLPSGILSEKPKKKARSFRCTDYGKWNWMTRCVNR